MYSQEFQQNLIQEAIQKVISIPNEYLWTSKAKTDNNILDLLQPLIEITKSFSSNSNAL